MKSFQSNFQNTSSNVSKTKRFINFVTFKELQKVKLSNSI